MRPRLKATVRLAAIAAVLALGAPIGWLITRPEPWRDLATHQSLYAYLMVGTVIAFATFGAVVGSLVERLNAANERLRELSLTDALTGLRNPRFFEERLTEECARADRDDTPLGLVVIDLDRFKTVNDRHGHAMGDRALRHVARTFAAAARTSDVVCRIGGEEFAVICPNSDLEATTRAAERIRAALFESPLVIDSVTVPMTGSFGVAVRRPGSAVHDALGQADRALYVSKARGRNRVEAFSSASQDPFRSEVES